MLTLELNTMTKKTFIEKERKNIFLTNCIVKIWGDPIIWIKIPETRQGKPHWWRTSSTTLSKKIGHGTADTWHLTCDMWRMKCDTWHMTHRRGWTVSLKMFSPQFLQFWIHSVLKILNKRNNQWQRC